MKFLGNVCNATRNKWLEFEGALKKAITEKLISMKNYWTKNISVNRADKSCFFHGQIIYKVLY